MKFDKYPNEYEWVWDDDHTHPVSLYCNGTCISRMMTEYDFRAIRKKFAAYVSTYNSDTYKHRVLYPWNIYVRDDILHIADMKVPLCDVTYLCNKNTTVCVKTCDDLTYTIYTISCGHCDEILKCIRDALLAPLPRHVTNLRNIMLKDVRFFHDMDGKLMMSTTNDIITVPLSRLNLVYGYLKQTETTHTKIVKPGGSVSSNCNYFPNTSGDYMIAYDNKDVMYIFMTLSDYENAHKHDIYAPKKKEKKEKKEMTSHVVQGNTVYWQFGETFCKYVCDDPDQTCFRVSHNMSLRVVVAIAKTIAGPNAQYDSECEVYYGGFAFLIPHYRYEGDMPGYIIIRRSHYSGICITNESVIGLGPEKEHSVKNHKRLLELFAKFWFGKL